MAIDDFWRNLQTAASLYAPSATTDSAHVDAGAMEQMLRGAVRWLTPRSVDGFRIEDFEFLEEEQRSILGESVERFLAVARQVPGNKPATPEQAEEGRAAFEAILRVLQPDRFKDAESFRTQVLLDRELEGKLPGWVTGISCETGLDLVGDPAIWIWVDVTDDATNRRKVAKEGQAIHETIETAYRRIGGRRWPFIRFRSPDASARRQGASA
jgi:hypothetical protein